MLPGFINVKMMVMCSIFRKDWFIDFCIDQKWNQWKCNETRNYLRYLYEENVYIKMFGKYPEASESIQNHSSYAHCAML